MSRSIYSFVYNLGLVRNSTQSKKKSLPFSTLPLNSSYLKNFYFFVKKAINFIEAVYCDAKVDDCSYRSEIHSFVDLLLVKDFSFLSNHAIKACVVTTPL